MAAAAPLADERLQWLLRLRMRACCQWTGIRGRQEAPADSNGEGSEHNGNEGDEESKGVEGDEGEGEKGDNGNFPEGGGR